MIVDAHYHLDPRLGLEDHPEARADQGLVVGEQDPGGQLSPPRRRAAGTSPGW